MLFQRVPDELLFLSFRAIAQYIEQVTILPCLKRFQLEKAVLSSQLNFLALKLTLDLKLTP